ncbi:MAG: hypothetical protein DRP85_07305 [Candidatus Makaraimicrobium thalassicum]|nr:MAG: hypothetical protein DRP85_07305 [Candidatus Omnitrophota bacterium]
MSGQRKPEWVVEVTGIRNFKVEIATNGKNGIELAKRAKPDLIILDIIMPGMSGFKVLEKLKKNDDTMTIPVIMLSALDDDESKMKTSVLYHEKYVTKPVEVSALKREIGRILGP